MIYVQRRRPFRNVSVELHEASVRIHRLFLEPWGCDSPDGGSYNVRFAPLVPLHPMVSFTHGHLQ